MGLSLIVFASLALPSIAMGLGAASSLAAGTAAASAAYIVIRYLQFSSVDDRGRFSLVSLLALGWLFTFYLTLQFSLALKFSDFRFDFSRFWFSWVLCILQFSGALAFATVLARLREDVFCQTIYSVFGFLVLCGMVGAAGVSPILNAERYLKSVLFFTEPSHFALVFTPFLMFMVVSSGRKWSMPLVLLGYVLGLALQNLTLLVGSTIILFVAFRLAWLVAMIPAVVLTLGMIDTSYYSDRLNPQSDNSNLSVLVYRQGMALAWEGLTYAGGTGFGFQQLGIVSSEPAVADEIVAQSGGNSNLSDGGFTAAKIIGEFGLVGAAAVLLYLCSGLSSFLRLRRLSGQSLTQQGAANAFFHCCFVCYGVEVFVRGTGYFSPSAFLFLCAVVGIFFAAGPLSSCKANENISGRKFMTGMQ